MKKPLKDWTLAEVLTYCENCEGCPIDCLFRNVCGHGFVVLDLLEDWGGVGMLNKVVLMGRLTRDPVLRRSGDTSVVNFTLAVDRGAKTKDGKKLTDFIDIVAWGKLADWCTNWIEKGTMVIVVGPIQSRNWEDRYGNKRVSVEVRADEVQFGETKKARDANASANSAADPYAAPPRYTAPPGTEDFTDVTDEDDPPF